MRRSHVSPDLSRDEEIEVVGYLTNKGFTQKSIVELFGGRFSQSSISTILKQYKIKKEEKKTGFDPDEFIAFMKVHNLSLEELLLLYNQYDRYNYMSRTYVQSILSTKKEEE